jgi:branched-chain amino acid aminotransferase/4-amino-4-deoxychorismate lyase
MTGVASNDRGFTLGDGLFETVLARGGRLVQWGEHMARLRNGCEALGLPVPAADACEARAFAALDAAGLRNGRAAVRLTWSAGPGGRGLDRPADPAPQLVAGAAPLADGGADVALATVAIRRNPTSPAARHKTLAYLDNVLARREARASGADEALMLSTAGDLACAAAANLFWIREERLFTPALECGVLGGTVRAALLADAGAVEIVAKPEALAGAGAVFLTNSLIGLQPVRAVDGIDVDVGHPWLAELAALVDALE